MAIKDQCLNCRHNLPDDKCNVKTGYVEYNATSCEAYQKRGIDLSKHGDVAVCQEMNCGDVDEYAYRLVKAGEKKKSEIIHELISKGLSNEQAIEMYRNAIERVNSERGEIHGWLSFFLGILGIGVAISVIYNLVTIDYETYNLGFGHWVAMIGMCGDVILFLGYGVLAAYTIVSFYRYRPNAVFLAKSYLVIGFTNNLLLLLLGEYDDERMLGSVFQLAGSLIWGVIWFLSLSLSEQVKTLFPKKDRKIYKRDKYLLAVMVGPAVLYLSLCYSLALAQGGNMNENSFIEAPIDRNTLSYNEYTDGRIVFTRPMGFNVEEQIVEDVIVYTLSSGNEIAASICSAYENNDNQAVFEECMQAWKDTDLDGVDFDIIDSKHDVSNGNSIYKKTLLYQTDFPITWTFVMIFNKETNKCCVVSYYSSIETDDLMELINKIRFK